MTIYVVDTSNNNPGVEDFNAARNGGYSGVILKATEGAGFRDGYFINRARDAHAAGLVVGAYAFVHTSQAVQPQADAFNQMVVAAGVPIPIRCADVEVNEGNVEGFTQAFCPAASINLLYSGAYFAQSLLSQPIAGVDWWIAAYGQSNQPHPPWGTEAGWQFSSGGTVPGVPGQVDVSVFDDVVWGQLIGKPPFPGGTDVPAPTDRVRKINGDVPGSKMVLTADGGVGFFGFPAGHPIPQYSVLSAPDGNIYSFPWAPGPGQPAVIAYPGLPPQYHEKPRYFTDIWLGV